MTTTLLTAYDSAMAPIGDLTSPVMLNYANRHGFKFICARNMRDGVEPYWQKIWEIRDIFANNIECRVIWMDADILITNPDFVPPWFTGFQASFDWGTDAVDESMFSACCFVLGSDMREFIEAVAASYETFKGRPFPEQAAMRHLYVNGDSFKYRMRTHSRRTFNAVPREISEDAPEPWQPGDFAAHLTHLAVEERVRVFHEIRRQAE